MPEYTVELPFDLLLRSHSLSSPLTQHLHLAGNYHTAPTSSGNSHTAHESGRLISIIDTRGGHLGEN